LNYNIDVSPQFSEQLTQAARARGIDPTKLLESLVAEHLSSVASTSASVAPPAISAKNAAAIAYLDRRVKEEATDDPEEIRKADAEVEGLIQSLNRNRIDSGERPLFP
jgi:hypothetical protein